MRAWILYSIARIGVFVVAVVVLRLLLGDLWTSWWWLGVLCAAIIAFCISYIFFGGMRARVATDLAARATRKHADPDAIAEDVD